MPSNAVLAERIKGETRLRNAAWRDARAQRSEDRIDRAKKDEELNGVRTQLAEQAATFATKEAMAALEKSFDAKLDTAIDTLIKRLEDSIDRINTRGSDVGRDAAAEQRGSDEATKDLLASQGLTRRWLLGILVVLGIAVMGWIITVGLFALTHLTPTSP